MLEYVSENLGFFSTAAFCIGWLTKLHMDVSRSNKRHDDAAMVREQDRLASAAQRDRDRAETAAQRHEDLTNANQSRSELMAAISEMRADIKTILRRDA